MASPQQLSEAHGSNARQHGVRKAAGWRNGRMTDPVLPVLVRLPENATVKSIDHMRLGESGRRRPFRQDRANSGRPLLAES